MPTTPTLLLPQQLYLDVRAGNEQLALLAKLPPLQQPLSPLQKHEAEGRLDRKLKN